MRPGDAPPGKSGQMRRLLRQARGDLVERLWLGRGERLNVGIANNACSMAAAMGNYYFTSAAGNGETKVEYTFG